ncbi:MAG: hypothetical protein H0U87_04735 [Acidobacteria bacterium]|nr:hypothetical protein [Acidobacteriota bacterium]
MIFKNFYRLIFSLGLILFLLGNVFALNAHTYHTSLTRIDYKTKENLVEISIQLFTHDFVPALERRAKKPIDLEKTPEIDKIILDFVNANFVLKDKTDRAKKLVFVGKEIQVDTVFVYVETDSDEDLENFSLRNTLFFDAYAEQTNRVVARYSDKKADLIFKAGDEFKKIQSAKTEK